MKNYIIYLFFVLAMLFPNFNGYFLGNEHNLWKIPLELALIPIKLDKDAYIFEKLLKTINKSTIDTILTFTIFITFIPCSKTLTILFRTTSLLTVTPLDSWIFMPERYGGSYHDLIDGLRSNLTELLCVMAAFAVTVLAERSFNKIYYTIGKAFAVEFQTLWFFAFALRGHGLRLVGVRASDEGIVYGHG